MSRPCSNRIPLRPLALLVATLAATTAHGVRAEEAAGEKAVEVRDSASGLQVSIEPAKSSFRVGEPLQFRVQGNRRFHLYVYTIDPQTKRAVLVLPNARQRSAVYEPGKTQSVPGRTIEFVSDRPGTEKFVMLASAQPIDIKIEEFTKDGDFWTVDNDEWESQLEAKGIRIRDPDPAPGAGSGGGGSAGGGGGGGSAGGGGRARNEGVVMRQLAVRIVGEARSAAPPAEGEATSTAVFVATSRERYLTGDRVSIVYGADHSGWVRLYTVEPDGTRALLTTQQVDGRTLRRASARAEAPAGRHALVAIYSPTEDFDDSRLPGTGKDLVADNADKALTLEGGDAPVSYDVRRFWIDE